MYKSLFSRARSNSAQNSPIRSTRAELGACLASLAFAGRIVASLLAPFATPSLILLGFSPDSVMSEINRQRKKKNSKGKLLGGKERRDEVRLG